LIQQLFDFGSLFFKGREKMKKVVIFLTVVILAATGGISVESQVYGQSHKKVLMFLREGYSYDLDFMLKMEVGVMTKLLKEAGFQVDVATYSGQPVAGPTEKIEKVMKLSEIKLDDYMGIIIPCLNIMNVEVAPETLAVVKKAHADGKPVAAALSSVTVLADAGLLKGKKYAFYRDPLEPPETKKEPDPRSSVYAGAIYSGRGVVQDAKIITSGGCPASQRWRGVQDRTVELTQTFIAAIGP
jgi:putative intracellular protease/amidase